MEPTKKEATAEAVALQEEINLEFAEMTLQQIKTLKARGLADPLTMKEIRKNVAFLNKRTVKENSIDGLKKALEEEEIKHRYLAEQARS